MKFNFKNIALLCLLFVLAQPLHAQVSLGGVLNHNAVVQRDRVLPVWGTARDGEHIEVEFAGQRVTTVAKGGRWLVRLSPLPASGPFNLVITGEHDLLTLTNILVGDVWLVSGQSNMQMPVKECDNSEQECLSVDHPNLRLCTVKKGWNGQPQTHAEASWRLCSPDAARDFSAVGYFFASELLKDSSLTNVPIALVDSSVGGTMCEAWIPQTALNQFDTNMLHDSMFGIKPAMLYNSMIAPLGQTPFTGVIWYQGEGNAGHPADYPKLLSTLIGEWRQQFKQPRLPFFVVQLPDYVPDWGGYYWTWIREAQAKTARAVPNTSLILGIETTDGTNLHPKQKLEIGRRAALQARHVVYHENIISTGPVFKRAQVKGATVKVTFITGGNGLVCNSTNGLSGFAVAGVDGVYHPASGRIDGDNVIVQSDLVPKPKTVRYAWSGVPNSTLRNQAGLPAAPFRTDELPYDRVQPPKN